jgi:cytochrome c2
MDSTRGRRVFETQGCIQCHSVNGQGGNIAPDLGRVIDRSFTPAALASTMWNHAPTMWAAMQQRDTHGGDLDEQSTADLFAYFYAARFFEKPGDAARGKRLFTERSCDNCHGITVSREPRAKPITQWESLSDPVTLTQAMWNHAPDMWAELQRHKISWPELSGQDLSDLLVYLRNLPSVHAQTSAFEISGGLNGEALFNFKGCHACHDPGTLFAQSRKSGRTLTEVAAVLWNHGPKMPTQPVRFAPGEMRDLLSFVWARQFFEDGGDPARGKRVFAAKRCAACHEDRASGAPDLTSRREPFTGITMVSALWRHGPRMLEQMKQKGVAWPRFQTKEMSDLIAYLNPR